VEQASRVANLYPNALAHEEYRWNSIDEAMATNLSSGIHTLRLVPFMQYSKDTSYMQGLSADEQDLIERSIFIRDVKLEKATPRALPGAIEAESHRRFGEPFSTLSRLPAPSTQACLLLVLIVWTSAAACRRRHRARSAAVVSRVQGELSGLCDRCCNSE